jgi:hypothetical protein
VGATESTAHVRTTTETAGVSTPTTATVSTTTTARKRVSGQSPGESGGHSQNDHGLT